MCHSVVSPSGGTERAPSKINQLLKFVSEIQKGRLMDRCDWVGIGEVLVPGLRSQGTKLVPARDGQVVIGLLIIGTVASNQGSGHCRLLTPRFSTHLETSTTLFHTLDPKSTRSADLLDAE